ncbi:MAG: response regulator [Thermodesulfobacteriota bacterium]
MIDIKSASILIVDDMDPMCKSIRGMLKVLNFGKQFRYANNGAEAWKILQEESVDIAIIDWNMPVMTGVELLNTIREDRRLRDLPVVMVTAEAERSIVAEVAESDIDAYLLKPLTVKALEEKIRFVVDKVNNPPPMMQHLRQARKLEESGDGEGAIAAAKAAMKEDPSSSRPIRELGILYYKKQDFDTAEKCFARAVKMNKLDVFAFHYLGEISLKRDNIDQASTYFNKAMAISPRHVSRGVNFGKVLVKKGMVRKATSVFDSAIEISKEPLVLREEIADFCFESGIYNYAITLMEFIIKQIPTRIDLLYKLGLAYESINENHQAIRYFQEVERKEPKNIDVKMHLAKNYLASDQAIRADGILQGVLRVEPDNQEAQELMKKCV